jgi:hypothetical protein
MIVICCNFPFCVEFLIRVFLFGDVINIIFMHMYELWKYGLAISISFICLIWIKNNYTYLYWCRSRPTRWPFTTSSPSKLECWIIHQAVYPIANASYSDSKQVPHTAQIYLPELSSQRHAYLSGRWHVDSLKASVTLSNHGFYIVGHRDLMMTCGMPSSKRYPANNRSILAPAVSYEWEVEPLIVLDALFYIWVYQYSNIFICSQIYF